MSVIRKIDRAVGGIEDYLSILAFFLMIVDVIVIVICRYILKTTFTQGEEIARYLMIWCAYSGAAYGFRHHAHVGVVVFSEKFPEKWQPSIEKIRHMVTLVIIILLFVFTYMDFANRVNSGQVSTALGMSMAIVVVIIPFSLLLGIFHIVMDIMGDFSPKIKLILAENCKDLLPEEGVEK